jgi:hypothetical protein
VQGGTIGRDRFDIVVTNRPGNISLALPVEQQLTSNDSAITSAFPYGANSIYYPGVRVPPNWSFSLGFQSWTYTNPSGTKVFYSANMVDGSPLPDWLYFNNDSVTFDGVAPSTSKTQVYQVLLAGGDVPGFQDISQSFNITISPTNFTEVAEGLRVPFNVTADGRSVNASLNVTTIGDWLVDGKAIHQTDLSAFDIDIAASKVDGLQFDKTTGSLTGTVPADMAGKKVSVPVGLVHKSGEVLNSTLNIAFLPSIWKQVQLEPSVLTKGQDYKVDLRDSLNNHNEPFDLSYKVDPEKAAPFVHIDSAKDHIISGNFPSDVDYDSVKVQLTAVHRDTRAVSTAELQLSLSGHGTEPATLAARHGLSKSAIIAIASVCSLVGAILLFGLILCCLRRSRKRQESETGIAHYAGASDAELGDAEKSEFRKSSLAEEYAKKMTGSNISMAGTHGSISTAAAPVSRVVLPHLLSGLPGKSPKQTMLEKINPFNKPRPKSRVKISKPIVTPSLNNAAFQAQLAQAVEQAGIVDRSHVPDSEFTESIHSSVRSESRADGDVDHSEGSEHETRVDDQSHRSSWESGESYHWTDPDRLAREASPEDTTDGCSNRTSGLSAWNDNDYQEGREYDESYMGESTRPPTEMEHQLSADDPSRHVVTPTQDEPEGPAISIDNIYFPTESDLASSSLVSSDSDKIDTAVISVAARYDPRHTLESPVLVNSPASDQTARAITTPSVMVAHSRLVNFGKQKTVQVVPDVNVTRNISHMATIHNSQSDKSSVAVQHEPRYATPQTIQLGTSGRESRATNHTARSNTPSDDSEPTPRQHTLSHDSTASSPPSPLPSLPVEPSEYRASRHSHMTQRILLGVEEPFHFYPPLNLMSSAPNTTSTKPIAKEGAEYAAYLEPQGSASVRLAELPQWLRFEDMEVWGLPTENDRGTWQIRIVENLRGAETIVGRFVLEVGHRSLLTRRGALTLQVEGDRSRRIVN